MRKQARLSEATGPVRPPVVFRVGQIGRYRLRESLGEGGLGVVYAAYDPELDRQVAIKLIRPDESATGLPPDERLLREAQAIARLSHRNVVEVFDLGSFQGEDGEHGLFIVMELLVGKTVEDWLGEGPAWEDVLAVFRHAACGLEAAHAAGVVHRDFKPANLFLCDDGTVKVLDFGLAKLTIDAEADLLRTTMPGIADIEASLDDAPPPTEKTGVGTVLGTPAYMAPEQHVGDVSDPACDQFAFCVSLYRALFGLHPFAGNSALQIATAKLENIIVQPPGPCAVPSWIEDVVKRGMAPTPRKRWSSMTALIEALTPRKRGKSARRVLSAGLAAGAIAFALPPDAPDAQQTCEDGADRAAGVWNDDARAKVAARFAATGTTGFEQVAQDLDAYVEGWRAARLQSCTAQPEAIDHRLQCLDERLSGLTALVGSLEHSKRGQAPRTSSLVPVADCSDAP